MRLRNIPRAEAVLTESEMVVKDPSLFRGQWQCKIFNNENPIYIEIGMGKGQFLLTLAKQNPQINYIGIERYSSVLLRAVEKTGGYCNASEPDIYPNVRFLCIDAREIPEIFAPGEVGRIYLNFSDPWPKSRHAKRRLTSTEYFDRYDKVLSANGQVEFKTDNRGLFDFSVEQLKESHIWYMSDCTYDLHNDSKMNTGNVMTEYEEKFSSQGNSICKLIAKRKFTRNVCI